MAFPLKNWLGPLIDAEVGTAIEWMRYSQSGTPTLSQKDFETLYENDGSNLRIKCERGAQDARAVQLRQFTVSEDDPPEAAISDGHTIINAKFDEAVLHEYRRRHNRYISSDEGAVVEIPCFEIVTSLFGASGEDRIHLLITELSFVGFAKPWGNPKPAHARSKLSKCIDSLLESTLEEDTLMFGSDDGAAEASDDEMLSQGEPDAPQESSILSDTQFGTQFAIPQMETRAHDSDLEMLKGVNLSMPQAPGFALPSTQAKEVEQLPGLLNLLTKSKGHAASSVQNGHPRQASRADGPGVNLGGYRNQSIAHPGAQDARDAERAGRARSELQKQPMSPKVKVEPLEDMDMSDANYDVALDDTDSILGTQISAQSDIDAPDANTGEALDQLDGRIKGEPRPSPSRNGSTVSRDSTHTDEEAPTSYQGQQTRNLKQRNGVRTANTHHWTSMKFIKRSICKIPEAQIKLLNPHSPSSWQPPSVGTFPPGNLPVNVLIAINAVAEKRAKRGSAATKMTEAEASSDSDLSERDDDVPPSSEERQMSWSASPSQRQRNDDLPPESSIPEQSPHEARIQSRKPSIQLSTANNPPPNPQSTIAKLDEGQMLATPQPQPAGYQTDIEMPSSPPEAVPASVEGNDIAETRNDSDTEMTIASPQRPLEMTASHAQASAETTKLLEYHCLYAYLDGQRPERWRKGHLKFHKQSELVSVTSELNHHVGHIYFRADKSLKPGDKLRLDDGVKVEVQELVATLQSRKSTLTTREPVATTEPNRGPSLREGIDTLGGYDATNNMDSESDLEMSVPQPFPWKSSARVQISATSPIEPGKVREDFMAGGPAVGNSSMHEYGFRRKTRWDIPPSSVPVVPCSIPTPAQVAEGPKARPGNIISDVKSPIHLAASADDAEAERQIHAEMERLHMRDQRMPGSLQQIHQTNSDATNTSSKKKGRKRRKNREVSHREDDGAMPQDRRESVKAKKREWLTNRRMEAQRQNSANHDTPDVEMTSANPDVPPPMAEKAPSTTVAEQAADTPRDHGKIQANTPNLRDTKGPQLSSQQPSTTGSSHLAQTDQVDHPNRRETVGPHLSRPGPGLSYVERPEPQQTSQPRRRDIAGPILHASHQEAAAEFTPQDVFESFVAAYPEYREHKGDRKHFMGLCRMIERLEKEERMQHKSLWDDFIIRHKSAYSQYLIDCTNDGVDPVPYEKFYREEIDSPAFTKRVMTPGTLRRAVEQEYGPSYATAIGSHAADRYRPNHAQPSPMAWGSPSQHGGRVRNFPKSVQLDFRQQDPADRTHGVNREGRRESGPFRRPSISSSQAPQTAGAADNMRKPPRPKDRDYRSARDSLDPRRGVPQPPDSSANLQKPPRPKDRDYGITRDTLKPRQAGPPPFRPSAAQSSASGKHPLPEKPSPFAKPSPITKPSPLGQTSTSGTPGAFGKPAPSRAPPATGKPPPAVPPPGSAKPPNPPPRDFRPPTGPKAARHSLPARPPQPPPPGTPAQAGRPKRSLPWSDTKPAKAAKRHSIAGPSSRNAQKAALPGNLTPATDPRPVDKSYQNVGEEAPMSRERMGSVSSMASSVMKKNAFTAFKERYQNEKAGERG